MQWLAPASCCTKRASAEEIGADVRSRREQVSSGYAESVNANA